MQKDNVVAIILGGGAGSRLFPLTQTRSKPAVSLGGKYRLIDIPISNCINSGITQIYVLTQYNSASLNKHIAGTFRFSNFSRGFAEVLAAEQTKDNSKWFQGTADAVRQMLPYIRDLGVETVLILSGDHLYRMDYAKFLQRHYETNADVTISVIPSTHHDAQGFGLLKTDANGKIIEFKEKPKGDALEQMRVDTTQFGLTAEEAEERPFLASMGIYVFNYKRLVSLLKEDERKVDFGGEIIPEAINNYNVQAHSFQGYWEDVGTIRAFYEANLDLAAPLPKFNLFDAEAPIYTRTRNLPPSKIHNCDIINSLVSEGCILNNVYARRSILGMRCRIEAGARIEDSIIMGTNYYESPEEFARNAEKGVPNIGIGSNSVIRRAIIDREARIGKNVQLINQYNLETEDGADGCYFIRDGIIVIPKDGIIADGTVI